MASEAAIHAWVRACDDGTWGVRFRCDEGEASLDLREQGVVAGPAAEGTAEGLPPEAVRRARVVHQAPAGRQPYAFAALPSVLPSRWAPLQPTLVHGFRQLEYRASDAVGTPPTGEVERLRARVSELEAALSASQAREADLVALLARWRER